MKVCSNNQNVHFIIVLTIFKRYMWDKYSKSNPNFKFSYQTFLDRLETCLESVLKENQSELWDVGIYSILDLLISRVARLSSY